MPLQLHSPGYPSAQLLESVERILSVTALCSMATRSEAGTVDINTAFFAVGPDLVFYFLSHPGAAHSRNLSHVPTMAMTVFDSHQEWGKPHEGLQLFGSAECVASNRLEQARAIYAARFTGYFDLVVRAEESGRTVASGIAGLQLYAFTPTRLKLLDEATFGDEVFLTVEVVRAPN
ncbi:MAG TPA: pyridoxamine 5'-phosphate oxidase family protein [Gemmatimonadales bacterium]|nr:pyridoxamine 5'-phosphate oxidase family protein [Gemmatimonadales bacterium]